MLGLGLHDCTCAHEQSTISYRNTRAVLHKCTSAHVHLCVLGFTEAKLVNVEACPHFPADGFGYFALNFSVVPLSRLSRKHIYDVLFLRRELGC